MWFNSIQSPKHQISADPREPGGARLRSNAKWARKRMRRRMKNGSNVPEAWRLQFGLADAGTIAIWSYFLLPRWLNMGSHRANIAEHGPNIGPTWAQYGPSIAQRRPNLGQYRPKMGTMAKHMPDLAQHKPKMGPRWLKMGPRWPNMGTTCAQHRPRLLPYRQALRMMPASVQHSPPWVCAEDLGPIFPHHKPKVVAWPASGCQA